MITNVKAGRYEHIELFGQPALFADERIARDAVPDGWYCYDLRGRDDDPIVPAAVEKHVFCNHAGSVLCPAPLDLGEDGYRELGDEPEDGVDFYGEEISFEDFRKAHGLTVPETEQKPRKHEVEHEPDNAFERLFTIGSMYLHVQRSDEGFDYTLYDRETKREIDGGQLDYDAPLLWDAALEICRLHELGSITNLQTADIAILDELLDEEDRGLKDNRARRYALYPAIDRNARFYYRADKELEFRRGCIGLVRMDVAPDSHKFWHCWFPRGPQEWNTLEFSRELGEVITALRQDVLKSLPDMRRFCSDHGGEIRGEKSQSYGYELETERYRYCLRCNPMEKNYNAYLICYDKTQEQAVGRLRFKNGIILRYHENEEFLSALRNELPHYRETGAAVDLLSDDPALRKEAEDIARWYCGSDYEKVMGEPDPEKPEDVFTIQNWFGNAVTVLPRVELYSVNDFMGKEMSGLAIVLDEAGNVPGEQFAVLTVSFGEFIGMKNAAYIDVNNCPFAHELLEAGIAEDTGLTKSSGFCDYPLWVFDEDFLREHSNGAYEAYEQEYDAYMESAEQEDEDQGMTWGGM